MLTPHLWLVWLLHGFIKKTRKTPKKDATIAIKNLEQVKNNIELSKALKTYKQPQ
jgi:phage-related protein